MTNREWLNSLSNVDLAYQIVAPCGICVYADRNCTENSDMRSCYEGCLKWLEQEHEGSENK